MSFKKIVIVGPPNVGKSSIFNNLSGRYATVSNYPGTTVEIFKAEIRLKGGRFQLIDTPGMNSILSLTEEERVACRILLNGRPDIVIQVAEAKNLEKALVFTFQLLEAELPLILVLNIIDEAGKEGIAIDAEKLEKILAIPVVTTISVRNEGITELKERITGFLPQEKGKSTDFPKEIERAIEEIFPQLKGEYGFAKRAVALLALQEDSEAERRMGEEEGEAGYRKIKEVVKAAKKKIHQPIEYLVNLILRKKARRICREAVREKRKTRQRISAALGELTLKPLVGVPLLLIFLYFAIYELVGVFGAGFLVDFLEGVFTRYINPFFIFIFEKLIPFEPIRNLFVGEYGIITLGLRYAVAIILPVVGLFFFVFSFVEDVGYLPRMGAMLDRLFKRIGLSGKAVIPMVLGLGCDTMATMVTRILPTKRERFIATFLLSLSVPCSAQLGVIMAVLSRRGWAVLIWFLAVGSVFSFSGFFLNKVLKGKKPSFHIELPPLRLPRLSNIAIKTYTRLKWYFKEVLPLFIWASIIIWIGQITKIFDFILFLLRYPLALIGLPGQLAKVFLFGFFRRDYGAAGLYDLDKQGLLGFRELLVSAVVLTLFLPCIAQFLMNIKERGLKAALAITVFILVFSFSFGLALNKILILAGL